MTEEGAMAATVGLVRNVAMVRCVPSGVDAKGGRRMEA